MAQNHQMLDVRKNGAFILNDTLLVDYRQQNLADILNELLSDQNRLESLVRRSLKDDERLLGQEKANIVSMLQNVLRNVVTLYFKIYDPEFASEFPKDPEVLDAKEGYMVKGRMNVAEVNVNFSLERWVKEYLEHALEDLVAAFQAAAKDHKITLAEKTGLIAKIGPLLTQTIQAFYLMRTGAVFK
jgi:hypothetical protein